ncbi:hypothetical protein ACFFIS_16345 [Virgibacillus soli]|uniref:YppG-like protein n=1 Tax=Paracerasibacillus soli TaxID=480284 RepID=A0ABU5CX63_9BACI|nr:hypothetical protein [Virgibacillus soli]MDY0410442.1 hypothetical protein [Virgibacillus soli]
MYERPNDIAHQRNFTTNPYANYHQINHFSPYGNPSFQRMPNYNHIQPPTYPETNLIQNAPNYRVNDDRLNLNYPYAYDAAQPYHPLHDFNQSTPVPLHQNGSMNQNNAYVTPFEQFSKPKLPENWHESTMNMQQDTPQPMFGQQQNMQQQNMQQQNMQQQTIEHQTPQQQNMQMQSSNEMYPNQKGQFDLDKVLTTVGQLANTYHQVSPIVKQVGSLLKTFNPR